MLARKYKAEVVSIENPLDGIYTVELKSLGRKFKYNPGQFLHLSLDSGYDGVGQWPESRCFSMQSNPEEMNIKITFSVRGSYTGSMQKELREGSLVWLKLPYGDLFSQSHSKENTVFIAGGTGITPFLSLFKHFSFKEYVSPSIYLGFRSKPHNIYNDDLCQLQNSICQIQEYYEDIDGLIDIERIFMENGTDSSYFISGPPSMIRTFKQRLIDYGISYENILTDEWE